MSPPILLWHGDYGVLSQFPGIGAYDDAYFDKYQKYAHSRLGEDLNKVRLELVLAQTRKDDVIMDIGVGCGQFVASRMGTVGYDVNPKAVEWLHQHHCFLDPYKSFVSGMTFWDSFEHIEEPRLLLERCGMHVFMSIPIFENREHVLRSKHFRPDEHMWYFTEIGLLRYMSRQGFELKWVGDPESKLGREDILTFHFKRLR